MNFNISKIYRPEIDGLRAIAVVLILLFHTGLDWASGGFIGVDVFFVISGYLITRNIVCQMDNGEFSFSKFYVNRIRRLMPALFFTLFFTLVLGFYIFSPNDLERLGKSLISAIFSLSNFFFWTEADYFNPTSDIKPLLHTWSLAVEEQFYLIWPAVLFGLYKLKNKTFLIAFFLISVIVSLYISELYIESHSEAVFFLLPFRVFEFSLGALCVFVTRKKLNQSIINDIVFIIGLMMIVIPAFTYSNDTVFPGVSALLPCLGASAIIFVGNSSKIHTLLSNKIMVGMGLISYSVYLIHWPIFVFYKYWVFEDVNNFEVLILLVLSVFAGFMMWKFVENPFRYKKETEPNQTGSSRLFLLTIALSAVSLFILSHYIWKKEGLSSRLPAEFLLSKKEIDANKARFRKNYSKGAKQLLVGDKNGRKVILMGNSHAVDLLYSFRENQSTLNFNLFSTSARCFNFGTPLKTKFVNYCKQKLSFYLKSKHFKDTDAVYLHDNWPRFNGEDLKKRLLEIRAVTSAPIYVIGPKMTYQKSIPHIVGSHMRMASINQYSKKFLVPHKIDTNNAVKLLIENSNIENLHFVDLMRSQCGENIDNCQIVSEKNNKFLYFDGGHFTLQGAKELGENLKNDYPKLF